MSVCRNCFAVMKWVVMEDTHKSVPVEPHKDRRGTVAAKPVPAARGSRLMGYVVSAERPLRDGYDLYVAHFAECERIAPKRPTTTNPSPTVEPAPSLFDAIAQEEEEPHV